MKELFEPFIKVTVDGYDLEASAIRRAEEFASVYCARRRLCPKKIVAGMECNEKNARILWKRIRQKAHEALVEFAPGLLEEATRIELLDTYTQSADYAVKIEEIPQSEIHCHLEAVPDKHMWKISIKRNDGLLLVEHGTYSYVKKNEMAGKARKIADHYGVSHLKIDNKKRPKYLHGLRRFKTAEDFKAFAQVGYGIVSKIGIVYDPEVDEFPLFNAVFSDLEGDLFYISGYSVEDFTFDTGGNDWLTLSKLCISALAEALEVAAEFFELFEGENPYISEAAA